MRTLALALVGVAAAGGVAWWQLASPSGPELSTPIEGGQLELGINEAVAIPARLLRQRPDIPALLAADAKATHELGATWVRAHSAVYPNLNHAQHRDHRAGDAWVRAVQAEGLHAVVMVSPWPGNQTAAHTASYVAPAGYAEWVGSVVERYDGDGVDDMPGLIEGIHHWEIDNEPDLKNTNVARGSTVDPETFCTPEQYLEMVRVTAAAVRAADADAVVLNGGIYRPHTETGQAYLAALVTGGLLDHIDVVSVHTYFDGPGTDKLERALTNTRELVGDRPVWLTETSVASEGDKRWMTPEWQAEMVLRVHATAMVHGVDKVFWHTLADPPVKPEHGISRHSLLRVTADGFADKPAAVAYRGLAERLAPARIEEGRLFVGDHELLLDGTARWAD
ncbi:MAG: hypothetical protein GY913_23580 [Proteobacteria bacterium]|nr:hypothetical protein [Pseudomonadota bacterium]MCP4919895.1 hypothetical protein [Pseudomonadota bacterium]